MFENTMDHLTEFIIDERASLRDVIAKIDANKKGIVLVVGQGRQLIGTVTDGDIRRGILAGIPLEGGVSELLDLKAGSAFSTPISASLSVSAEAALQTMKRHSVRHLPVVDEQGRVQRLLTLDDLAPAEKLGVKAVVMAGGFGTRLRPLTDETPKPMLPINGRPILEWIIERLKQAGIRDILLTTHYKPEKIHAHFGDGQRFGVDIEYVHEATLTGTAGPLALIEDWSKPLLVTNGDILTEVSFRALYDYHCDHQADLTVAVREFHVQVPYGVIEMDGVAITRLQEKPELQFFVNAGIYLLGATARPFIPQGRFFNMTDLIENMVAQGHKVVGFPVREYWMDIGQHAQYEQAQKDMSGKTPQR